MKYRIHFTRDNSEVERQIARENFPNGTDAEVMQKQFLKDINDTEMGRSKRFTFKVLTACHLVEANEEFLCTIEFNTELTWFGLRALLHEQMYEQGGASGNFEKDRPLDITYGKGDDRITLNLAPDGHGVACGSPMCPRKPSRRDPFSVGIDATMTMLLKLANAGIDMDSPKIHKAVKETVEQVANDWGD